MAGMLKRILLVGGLSFLASLGVVLLAPSIGSATPTCATTTLNNYQSLSGGCLVNDKLFANFNYTPSGTVQIPATGITVTPITTILDPGLRFSAAWAVTSNTSTNVTEDSKIFYTVHDQSGPLIKDNTLTIAGFSATGTGSVIVNETKCLGAFFDSNGFCSGSGGSITLTTSLFAGSPAMRQDTQTFPPVQDIGVIKDISLATGGGTPGTNSAAVSDVAQNFSEVPEPASFALTGIGLIGLGWLRQRRQPA